MTFSATSILLISGFSFAAGLIFLYLCKRNWAMAFLAVLLYSSLSKAASVFFLDQNHVYVTESASYSYSSSAWLMYLAAMFVMFGGAMLALRLFRPRQVAAGSVRGSTETRVGTLVLLLVAGLQVANIAISGRLAIPGTGVSRFNYWDGAALPLNVLFGELMIFFPLAAAIIAGYGMVRSSDFHRRLGALLFVFYLVLLVLQGQRFHGLMLGAGFGFAAYLYTRSELKLPLLTAKKFAVLLVTIALLFVVLWIEFSNRGLVEYTGTVSAAIVYRVLVLQGHTLWAAFQEYSLIGPTYNWQHLMNGLEFIMSSTADTKVLLGFQERGVNFATALPATLVMVSGITGVLVGSLLYGLIYGCVAAALAHAMKNHEAFSAMFLSFIWLEVHSIYAQASLQPLFGAKLWGGVVLYVAAKLVVQHVRVLGQERLATVNLSGASRAH